MADKRIYELEEAASVDRSAFLVVDDALNGTKKVSVGDVLDSAAEASTNKATGTSFALIGTSEGGALANTIYGMSVQDGTPTPTSPVEIKSAKANFKCVGKNLIPYPYFRPDEYVTNGITFKVNSDNSISFSGSTNTQAYYTLINITSGNSFPLKTNTRYKLVTDCSSNYAVGTFVNAVTAGSSGDLVSYTSQNEKKVTEFTTPADFNSRLQVGIWISNKTNISGTIKLSIVQADVTDTEYTPYQHADAASGLILRAIEVTSTDNYNLEKDGKYYIADTVDWSDDKGYVVTRRIQEFSVDGTENWQLLDSGTTNRRFQMTREELGIGTVKIASSLCSDHFVFNQSNSAVWGYCRLGNWFNLFDNNSIIADVTALNAFLGTNKPKFYYILETPVIESITPEQAMALLSLKTYDEATSIDCVEDVAPVVDLEYGSDRSSALALAGHNEAYIAQELEGLYGVKNLNSYPYYNPDTFTTNGVTFTRNSDGSVVANGTATADAYYALHLRELDYNKCLIPFGSYILSGCPGESSYNENCGIRLGYTKNGSSVVVGEDRGSGLYFAFEEGDDYYPDKVRINLLIFIRNGYTANNLLFKPMIRPASFQSDEYEPYAMSNQELTEKIVNSGLITEEDFSDSSVNGLYNKSVTNIIAGVENGANASKAYNANDLILRNHNLYEVTVDVASGTAWAVGTNIEVTTMAAQFARINTALSDLKISNRTLIDTITSFDNTTDHVYDFSEYNRIEFVILGNYTSATNKFHCVFDFLPSTIEIIRADVNNKTDGIAPAIVSECVVGGEGTRAQITTYIMSTANTFRFVKVVAGGYNITELKIYGLK